MISEPATALIAMLANGDFVVTHEKYEMSGLSYRLTHRTSHNIKFHVFVMAGFSIYLDWTTREESKAINAEVSRIVTEYSRALFAEELAAAATGSAK